MIDNNYDPLKKLEKATPEERLAYIKEQWNLTDDFVYGQITKKYTKSWDDYFTLKKVKNNKGKVLEYPLDDKDIESITRNVHDFGIYIGRTSKFAHGQFVKAQIEINDEIERDKSNNPLSVKIITNSLVSLDKIPHYFVIEDGEGNVIIEETLRQYVIKTQIPDIDNLIIEHKKELSDITDALSRKKNKMDQVENALSDVKSKKQQIEDSISEKQAEFHKLKNKCELSKQKEISQLEKLKEGTRIKMNQLNEYVQSKADFLFNLSLINQKEYNYVTGKTDQKSATTEKYLDFEKDLNGNFSDLISQIQSYLFSQKKYYTKHILETFLTLLRTNDLIIISGLSGSGKSLLVKSFAQAIGGVAKIVPVKPNWTSSEDLLGYYNPMQKSYLTTPFLNAIVEAKRDPNRLHLICLDEMNLARVEYYFADFLSILEERESTPRISLYSSEEADHVESEFRIIIEIFEKSSANLMDKQFSNFGEFLQHREISTKLHEIFGKQDNTSLVDLYGKLRRMISGVLNIPAEFDFPANVRIIGTINIDQTTHYFAPKVLDRAYLLKFESPLNYIDIIKEELKESSAQSHPIYLSSNDFWPIRMPYPDYDSNNVIVKKLKEWNNNFLAPLGIDFGMRVIRQSLLFQKFYKELYAELAEGQLHSDIINTILLLKILPHFMFDGDMNGSKKEIKKHDIVKQFKEAVEDTIAPTLTISNGGSINAADELQRMIQSAEHNNKVYNFWG